MTNPSSKPDLTHASTADADLLVDILTEAFSSDPVMNWVLRKPAGIRAVFRTMIRHVYLPRGVAYRVGEEGATLWLPHDADKSVPSLASLGLMARAVLAGGPGVAGRASATEAVMAKHKPREPHLYLFSIGVRDRSRGQGLGGALLDPILAECDAKGQAVYLENSNPPNHAFYASRGFQTREIFYAAEGAPPLEAMWRVPQG